MTSRLETGKSLTIFYSADAFASYTFSTVSNSDEPVFWRRTESWKGNLVDQREEGPKGDCSWWSSSWGNVPVRTFLFTMNFIKEAWIFLSAALRDCIQRKTWCKTLPYGGVDCNSPYLRVNSVAINPPPPTKGKGCMERGRSLLFGWAHLCLSASFQNNK